MYKRSFASFFLLTFLCITIGAQNKMPVKESARLAFDLVIESSAESFPFDYEFFRTESLRIQGNSLVYDNVIPDFTTYQNYKAAVPQLKSNYVEGLGSPQLGLIVSFLADLGMSLRYDFHSGARTSSFSVEISPSEIIESLGGEINREVRIKKIYEYYDFLFSRDNASMTSTMNEKGITIHVNQASSGLASTDVTFGKNEAKSVVFDNFVENEFGCVSYYMCMYLDVPLILRLIYLDKTVEVSLSSSELYEQYLKAKSVRENLETNTVDEDNLPSIFDFIEDLDDENNDEPVPFQLVEEKPTFMGGDTNKFAEWVNQNLKYPESARENGIQGRVTLQFTVNVDGSLSNVKVLRGADPALDREAVRVVSSSPKWAPGRQKGKPVKVTYTFPVIFQLQ